MRILLVQTSFLGDTVLSTPVIGALRRFYPEAELWALSTVPSAEMLQNDPELKGVLTYDKRAKQSGFLGLWRLAKQIQSMQFDKVYSLHRSFRTSLLIWLTHIPERIGFKQAKLHWLYTQIASERAKQPHEVQRNLSILGREALQQEDLAELRLFAPKQDSLSPQVQSLLKDAQSYVVLVPGSAWFTKMWYWQGYKAAAEHFLAKGLRVLLLGGASELKVCNKVAEGLCVTNLAAQTSISDMLALVKHASLVLCNDSMALHLASAFKVPNISIFCSTLPEFGFGPWRNERACVLERRDLECKPCGRHGHKRCPTGTQSCMQVSIRDVLKKADLIMVK